MAEDNYDEIRAEDIRLSTLKKAAPALGKRASCKDCLSDLTEPDSRHWSILLIYLNIYGFS